MLSVRGTVMQTPTAADLEVLTDVVIDVGDDGTITSIEPSTGQERVDVDLGDASVLLPGLIDAHAHAPQWPQIGTGLDLEPEDWLFERTFPLELRLCDPAFAERVWPDMVRTVLAHGTTTVAYHATVDVRTTTMLAESCAEIGQRALVGRVAMDHPIGTPEYLRDASASAGIEASLESIEQIRALGTDRVRPIVSPRFAPSCTDDLLRGLGELVSSTGTTVQTHSAETDGENEFVRSRFGVSDVVVLDRHGLIVENTILANGQHLGPDDIALIRDRGAGFVHCPRSNAYFGSAVFSSRRALDGGVPMGLGTDIAGGGTASIFGQCVDAVTVSRVLDAGVDAQLPRYARGVRGTAITIVEAFHMATAGGAALLGVPCGLIEVGRQFDAVAVDLETPRSPLRVWGPVDDHESVFEKVVRLTGLAEISDVWVAGRRVSGREPVS